MAESGTKSEPSQKRKPAKRTARACDECRLRKSKCDGLQPCEACQTTDRYCTYNLSAGRSTGSGTRIRILEDRLRRARAYLNEAQKRTPSLAHVDFDALLGPTQEVPDPETQLVTHNENDGHDDPAEVYDQEKLESMMESYGQMDVSTRGGAEREFYGASSGFAWIRKTRNYFEDDNNDRNSSSPDELGTENTAAIQLFDAPLPPARICNDDLSPPDLLPPRETATQMLRVVFTHVYPMFHFLCEEDFEHSTDRLYNITAIDYEESDQSFLPFFYLVMALGYLFSRREHSNYGCRTSVGIAMKYFIAARNLVDIAHLRTIISLQALISLILYLVSTARMASAHAFLGAACAAAMRQGLHFRSTHDVDFPDKEIKLRRRVFWAVVSLDMYITSILGLPPFIDISAVDPAIDITIKSALEEGGTRKELPAPDGIPLMASARYIELMRIVFKAQDILFPKPIDPPNAATQGVKISVSIRKLQAVETQFRDWVKSMTEVLTHPDDSIETQTVKYELHTTYYWSQIVLYRAFLHYLAKPPQELSAERHEVGYAMTCVTMAKKVIKLSVEHQRKGLLCPASWPSIYTVFIAIICLIFAYATGKDSAKDVDTHKDIEDGIRLLACTACSTDTGSVRCLEVLRRLLTRVSYAIDIEFDRICSETRPCCTIDFAGRNEGNKHHSLEELHVAGSPPPKADRRLTPASMSSVISNGRQWSLSPDVTMTQPSFAEVESTRHTSEEQTLSTEDEQMFDIPHGGFFNWHGLTHDTGNDNKELSSSQRWNETSAANTSGDSRSRLTADDIAAFMSSNPLDTPNDRQGE